MKILSSALLCLGIFLTAVHIYPYHLSDEIKTIHSTEKFAHSYPMPKVQGIAQFFYGYPSKEFSDNLDLWQGETLLTQGNQSHSVIQAEGNGRYSLWNGTLHFSTLKNTPFHEAGKIHYYVKLEPSLTASVLLVLTCCIFFFLPLLPHLNNKEKIKYIRWLGE